MQYFTGKEGKGVGCCVGCFVVVVGFWVFFFRFPQVSVFILQGKEMDCKDLPIPWVSQCVSVLWGVALSHGVR